jgi:hypothetical protein
MGLRAIVLGVASLVAAPLGAQQATASAAGPPYLTVGLFIGAIEEGARIFTPVRLLPRAHPEAMGHDFPTVLQFHRGEVPLLTILGQRAGLLLATTLQRYPQEPDTAWPYAGFRPPPVDRYDRAAVITAGAREAPLPGLRAVAYLDGSPLAFIVDTRRLTLAERGMHRATSAGLDVSRDELLDALRAGAARGPATGAWILVFSRP